MTDKNSRKISANSDYKTQIEKNGSIAFVPGGNSMWPTLKNKGQSVIIEKKQARLKQYDVGFFTRDDGTFVLHRVMKVYPDGYLMLGDSQRNPEKISEDQVFGVMTGFYKGKKFISAKDDKFIKKAKKWFERPKMRAFRLKMFFIRQAIKKRLKGDKKDV